MKKPTITFLLDNEQEFLDAISSERKSLVGAYSEEEVYEHIQTSLEYQVSEIGADGVDVVQPSIIHDWDKVYSLQVINWNQVETTNQITFVLHFDGFLK